MRKRETKGVPSADLLVCFPSRAHLTLLPKPICSPARPPESTKRHQNHYHHHLKKLNSRGGGGCGPGQASPLLWAKNKQMGTEIAEPTSPKVTCAGQIKVRHKVNACKSWQSVMEEIERIHNKKKKSSWINSFGFKKDVMQFLTCLRKIRFDFRCFGSIPQSDMITSDDDEEEDDDHCEEENNHAEVEGSSSDRGNEGSRTIFSKWFMVLQDNQNNDQVCKDKKKENYKEHDQSSIAAPSVPPPNALLLMRCRSAPAKSWLEEKQEEEEEEVEEVEEEEKEEMKRDENKGKNLKALIEEEKRNIKKERLVVMRYDTDFYKISTDIAKETWIIGGMPDPLSRSRSWKR